MRLFVALLPPRAAVEHLAAAVEPLRDDVLRWAGTDAWHVTLAFYGELPDSVLDDVTARVARAARRHPAVELTLAGAGRFGKAVLWAGVQGDVAAVRRCAQSMRAVGRRVGVPPDDSKFRPHVTLARSRRPRDLRWYVEQLAGYQGPAWTVTEVALVRSDLDTEPGAGPRYDVVGRFPLGDVTTPPPAQR
ncbi:2'-5' RNA ligase [Haloactinopolyspora alba]|uniref:RNA 2',3'-cyclic phosphodiesterase n=1 Tax=Haloactinopolyspora alba TaxID=648780 RepID=A0A2P8DM06_9ACTN|nr:RNA 2',3'-cyclic phosphodiesterase [Haloactinopolyspora alba]PSK98246.1 2'-5' RNA ligase [Haloactinopolyspora alba]